MLTDPCKALDSLDSLTGRINKHCNELNNQAHSIAVQWAGLRQVGGQRADHAAELIATLRPHLRGLAAFASSVETQLTAILADPFERDHA